MVEFTIKAVRFIINNDTETYSTVNQGESVGAERFIRTLKNKIYKYMTSVSKTVYIEKFNDIVSKYNNTYHRTIKVKLLDVKPSIYIDFNKENNKETPKFKVSDNVRIWKYKSFFTKDYTPNWSVFVIKKVKNTVSWTYVISDLNSEEIVGTFYEKVLQKTNKKEFRVEKIKKKGDHLYVKWKGYDDSFKIWIDKKDIVSVNEYLPRLTSLLANVEVWLDLSNYATKTDLQNVTGLDASKLAKKTDLANLRSDVDILDIDKF